jgi:hypothetical protein
LDDEADLEQLMEQAEAGIEDVLRAYDVAEEAYVAAAANTAPAAVFSCGANTRAL